MIAFIVRLVVNGLALWAASELVDGVKVGNATSSTGDDVRTLLVVALIFGIVNAVLKPVLKLLTLPINLVTLGLFTFVINAFLLWLTSEIAGAVDVPFEVTPFWWAAILGALVVSFISWVLNLLLPGK